MVFSTKGPIIKEYWDRGLYFDSWFHYIYPGFTRDDGQGTELTLGLEKFFVVKWKPEEFTDND